MALMREFHGILKKVLLLVVFAALLGMSYLLGIQYVAHMHAQTSGSPTTQQHQQQQQSQQQQQQQQPQQQTPDSVKFKQQRNDLSKQLNLMKKAYGQQSCEQLKLLNELKKSVNVHVSENGGWCSEASSPNSTSHVWDSGISTALSKFFKGKTVASFGDGPGKYKTHMDSLGEVVSYTAYDGAPYCENVTNGLVKFLDLTAPQFGLPAYDWVISIEVGEHIPAKYEDIYFDNLARHAKEGIVLSWAVPGQGGLSHVNNKPLADVVAQMNKRGFDINLQAGEPLRKAAIAGWLRNNVYVYYRIHAETFIPDDV